MRSKAELVLLLLNGKESRVCLERIQMSHDLLSKPVLLKSEIFNISIAFMAGFPRRHCIATDPAVAYQTTELTQRPHTHKRNRVHIVVYPLQSASV